MSRKPKKGYFVRGHFVAEGSELDMQLREEQRAGGPSKTELKAQSAELQDLGEQLLSLRADLKDPLDLPTRLLDALDELARITNFEGRRRQSQFVGKQMRLLGEEQIAAIRAALEVQQKGSAKDTLRLHAAERWRDRLIAEDAAVGAWATQFPDADLQPLRALVRQARKDALPPKAAAQAQTQGRAPRQGRAYRELFQMVHQALGQAEARTPPVHPIDADDAGYTNDSLAS
ncbi:ribosome biogenesis factor YjgA [Ottowia sp.]|uniref:ribosome biogenesis factor YjgA n=1 Tax=Ottowia sp. TaxID=1898956 RepID=UPI003A85AD27